MDLKQYVKKLRVNIDESIQDVEAYLAGKHPGAREAALVKTKLQEAKMWAGQILGELGSLLPPEFQDKAE